MTNFRLVAAMNIAFGNPRGDANNINWEKVRKQSLNVVDEMCEMFAALGADKEDMKAMSAKIKSNVKFVKDPDLDLTRDSVIDQHVFLYGMHHLMGINADIDMKSVIKGVMTRFIRDDEDKENTIRKHMRNGVVDVYFEGNYPTMIMKSGSDQPDAPKGKFMKSASYKEPVFYDVKTEYIVTPEMYKMFDHADAMTVQHL